MCLRREARWQSLKKTKQQAARVHLRVWEISQRQRLQEGDVCIDSGHMLSAAFQHGCPWCDLSKDI